VVTRARLFDTHPVRQKQDGDQSVDGDSDGTSRRRPATFGAMRRTLIASSVAALALVGLAGGAVYAAESDSSPGAAPTTLAPGMEVFADMGLTPEQAECLVANVGAVDMNDLTALMALMTQCGISTEQLLQIGQTSDTTTVPEGTVAASPESTPPVELDSATVAAVFEVMGLDEATVDCLVEGASTAAPTDDQSAELVFLGCGVGPLAILDAIVALDAQSGAIVTEDLAVVEDTVTGSLEPPASVASSGNAMVDLLLEQLAAQGINLDATQGQCILDNISDFDPNDMASVLSVLETCGIDIADLIPGG
jgi:hypothetical protein